MPPLVYTFDAALISVYAFFLFFVVLCFWLHYEGKREGYPLVRDTKPELGTIDGFPLPPRIAKTFKVAHRVSSGGRGPASERDTSTSLKAEDLFPQGQPSTPTGNPIADGVGPGSWVNRVDEPDRLFDGGAPKIQPLRNLPDWEVPEGVTDPRGKPVVTFDRKVAGTVVDLWVDQAEFLVRYYEVELPGGAGRVLLPMGFARVTSDGTTHVKSVSAELLAGVPKLKNPDVVTLLEEDKISGWYGGGQFYATPDRSEPIIL